ncbi:MAG: DUF1499 domain-containing protein [Pseudomonadota bacterium]
MGDTLFRLAVLATLAIFCTLAVALLAVPDKVWETIAGDPDLGPVVFQTLEKTEKPNQFLVCPPDYCQRASIDMEAPVFPVPAKDLKAAVDKAAMEKKNVTRVFEGPLELRYLFRSPAFRFPDTVSIEFIDVNGGSTLAIYARAQLGYADFGVNEKRVKKWLEKIQAQFSRDAAPAEQADG